MCGLAGAFRTAESNSPIDTAIISKMRDTMCHRGPDDSGIFISEKRDLGMGHRRLSIIDLNPNAAQPMSTQDENLWIVFNGEIYNHVELRAELEAKGHKFKTDHSDTEVLLKGYAEWGEAMLPRLRGMFAFGLWDKRDNSLWLVRDRMGVKPLYYTEVGGVLLFASEIKALFEYPGVKREMHEQAFYDFLTFLVTPAPQTLFKNIYKLQPGHSLRVRRGGARSLKQFWQPFTGVQRIEQKSEEQWVESLMSSLRESIRYRMVSDVKFGVFLSGGIDSSTNVALMAEQMSRPVETFSIGFKGASKFNELQYARMIMDRYKTNHHEIIIDADDAVKFLPDLIFHQDEPIVDPVCIPVYFVSKLAKDSGTTVCQVGEGADELFCGYPYWGMMLRTQPFVHAAQRIPEFARTGVWGLMNKLLPVPKRGMRQLELARRAAYGEPFFWGGAEAYQETYKQRLISDSYRSRLDGYTSTQVINKFYKDFLADAPPGADDLHWMSYLDLRFRLPELLLMRVDKMTMATSVEARVPFLDQEFIRTSMSIPQSVKYKDHVLKYILKKAVAPVLPKEIINRPKQGFALPVEDWFQQKLRAWSDEKIRQFGRRTDYFKPEALEQYLQHASSKSSWFLFNFVLWHERWIEGKEIELPA